MRFKRFILLSILSLFSAFYVSAQTPTLVQAVSSSNTKSSAGNGSITNGGTFNLPLPNASLSGNLLVCGVSYDDTGPPTVTIQDNQSNTYTLGQTIHDTSQGAITSLYYSANSTAGVTLIQYKPTGNDVHDFQMACYEFYNIATASPKDVSNGRFASSATITSNAMTTTVNGDLIVQYVARDSSATLVSYTQGSSPWILRTADQLDGQAMQYQVQPTLGAITPTLTASASHAFSSVSVSFKAASAGTAPAAGIRVLNIQHENTKDETSGTVTTQFPTKDGNTIGIGQSAGFNYHISSISDGTNTYTSVGCLSTNPADSACVFYAKNITPSAALSIVFTMAGTDVGGHGSSFFLYEITGADTVSPLDTSFGTSGFASASGNQDPTVGSGPVTTFTATPSGTNELMILVGSMAADTATGWSSPSFGQQVPTTYTGQQNPANSDENNPAGMGYNGASTAAQTWIFTHDTLNSNGVGTWVVVGMAFKPPGGGGVTPLGNKRAKLDKVDQ